MQLTPLLLNGIALGLGAAAPIGPVNVEIARRTLRFGRFAGFCLGCGAVTVDVAYAVATSAFVPAVTSPRVLNALAVAAAIFLAYLAWQCLRSARRGHDTDGGTEGVPGGAAAPPKMKHYLTGLLMTALNPMTLGFWFIAVPGAVANLTTHPRVDLPLVCAGVFLGAFAWVCVFTWTLGHLKNFGPQRWLRWVDLAGAATLLTFAIRSIWRVAAWTL
jgi:L-lysine exporter family protein LysE/ArgO